MVQHILSRLNTSLSQAEMVKYQIIIRTTLRSAKALKAHVRDQECPLSLLNLNLLLKMNQYSRVVKYVLQFIDCPVNPPRRPLLQIVVSFLLQCFPQ